MARKYGELDGLQFSIAVGSDQADKIRSLYIFGNNPDVDVAAIEDVWGAGGVRDVDAAPSIISIVSDDANDTSAGTGAQMVSVSGLDVNFFEVDEVVLLSGITPVVTTNIFTFVNSVTVISSGSGGSAAGTITITQSGAVQGIISPAFNRTKNTHYMMAANKTGFVSEIYTSGGPSDDFITHNSIRIDGTNTFVSVFDAEISNSNLYAQSFNPVIGPMPSKSLLKVQGESVTNNSQIRVGYNLIIVDNSYLDSLIKYI